MSDELKIAIEAAKVGAKTALKYFNKSLVLEYKTDKSPVTIADKEVEKAIIQHILKNDPKAKFLAEESGGDSSQNSLWIIDPIDGTRSFARGIPTWAILIAKYNNGKITCGVCYFSVLKNLLYAEKGKGAFLNGKKVHVSSISALNKAYTAYGALKHFKNTDKIVHLALKSSSSRSPDITYGAFLVACGKMDVCVDPYGQAWDAACFKVIIEEAGGTFTHMDGSKWTLKKRGFVATNGLLHDEVIRILSEQ